VLFTTLARDIAEYVHSVDYNDIPKQTIYNAKRLIIDTLGCGLGALDAEPVKIVTKVAQYVESGPEATVLGTRRKAAPDIAAFINGTMSRYLDYMDTYDGKEFSHPSDNILPVIAVVESENGSGRDVLLGTVLAYEIQCRLADAAALWTHGWDHVIYGLVSMSAVSARLMGLNQEKTEHAINLALNSHLTMRQLRVGEISMWKAPAFANSARNAIFSARLAGAGMTGPSPVFEGEMGFWKLVTGEFKLDVKKFGNKKNKFRLDQSVIKFYPAEIRAQTAIAAALQARKQFKSLEEVKGVDIGTNKAGLRILGNDPYKWDPKTKETADHSLPYMVAVALMDKKLDVNSYKEDRIRDRATLDFMKKIKVHEDKEFTRLFDEGGTVNAGDIKITFGGGRTIYEKQVYSKGHPKNPMTDEEIEEKFVRLTRRFVGDQKAEFILETLWNLDNVKNISKLFIILD
jgi:2-methylcitrate dehydratase